MSRESAQGDPGRIGKNIAAARIKQRMTQQQLGDELAFSRQTIIAFERGQRRPSSDQLARIADVLRTTVRDLVGLVPSTELVGARFRAQESGPRVAAAVQSLEEFGRRYATLEERTRQRLRRPAPPPLEIPAHREEQRFAEETADRARHALGLGDGAISDVRTVLEEQVGLRVFLIAELSQTQIDGLFAYSDDLGPLVGFKQTDPRRVTWTLCHEYAHFLTNRYDAEITAEPGVASTRSREERFANAFAASFLMPHMGLSKRFSDLLTDVDRDLRASHLVLLAEEFGVSVEALIRRLEEIGRIKRGTLQQLRDSGFRSIAAEKALDIERARQRIERWPRRYVYLLAVLVEHGEMAEGEAARYLSVDRLEARDVLQRYATLADGEGSDASLQEAILS